MPDDSPTAAAAGRNLSIVIPTYREAENLQPLAERIASVLRDADIDYEIVVVDDNSNDGSEEIVARQEAEGLPIRMIVRQDERGLSSAVLRGFDEACGEYLLCMDADLSHPPERIPDLLGALQGSDIEFVIGSRYVAGGSTEEGWGVWRWLNSKVATLLARPFTRARDPMAGFFALPRRVYARADRLDPIGYKIGLELIVKCRCRNVHEVPIHFADRHQGESKLNLREQMNYVRHIVRLARFSLNR